MQKVVVFALLTKIANKVRRDLSICSGKQNNVLNICVRSPRTPHNKTSCTMDTSMKKITASKELNDGEVTVENRNPIMASRKSNG